MSVDCEFGRSSARERPDRDGAARPWPRRLVSRFADDGTFAGSSRLSCASPKAHGVTWRGGDWWGRGVSPAHGPSTFVVGAQRDQFTNIGASWPAHRSGQLLGARQWRAATQHVVAVGPSPTAHLRAGQSSQACPAPGPPIVTLTPTRRRVGRFLSGPLCADGTLAGPPLCQPSNDFGSGWQCSMGATCPHRSYPPP